MRTLTLIILLTSACYGQDSLIHKWTPGYQTVITPGIMIIEPRTSHEWTPITLEDMDAYWQECWNDSTKQVQFIGWLYKDPKTKEIYVVDHRWGDDPRFIEVKKEFYTHREPTFAGFREWMRRKK
jgi:hypothetical protein